MKRLDELGVSPAPWQAVWHKAKALAWVDSLKCEDGVAEMCSPITERCHADAALIAAAPNMYEALQEAVVESCHDCDAYDRDHGDRCGQADGSCFVQRWRKALEKAGGGE